MDNVTHILFGALVAETALTSDRSGKTSVRALALWASVIANNLPDLDFLYARTTEGKLGYLLHHRGHTHTAPIAFALGVLTALAVFGWASFRKVTLSRNERRLLGALALAGPFFHIALDYTNNYGVHPFWPLNDGWYFGDSIFIVEPLLWVVSLPALLLLSNTITARALYAVLFAIALYIGRSRGVLSIVQILVLTNLVVASTFVLSRLPHSARARAGLAGWLLVTALFALEGRYARARLRSATSHLFPTTHVVDIVTTPHPANPFCWSAVVVGSDGERYVARRATVWTAPWKRARRCAPLEEATSTAPLEPLAVAEGEVHFEMAFEAPLAELRGLAEDQCTAAAFLRYARVPFWTRLDGRWLVGDLRFDRSRAIEFTEFSIPEPDVHCPRHVPPWTPPRIDLLHPAPR